MIRAMKIWHSEITTYSYIPRFRRKHQCKVTETKAPPPLDTKILDDHPTATRRKASKILMPLPFHLLTGGTTTLPALQLHGQRPEPAKENDRLKLTMLSTDNTSLSLTLHDTLCAIHKGGEKTTVGGRQEGELLGWNSHLCSHCYSTTTTNSKSCALTLYDIQRKN